MRPTISNHILEILGNGNESKRILSIISCAQWESNHTLLSYDSSHQNKKENPIIILSKDPLLIEIGNMCGFRVKAIEEMSTI